MSDDTAEKIELSKGEKAVIDALEKLNIIEVNNVVKFMEEEYGISAAPVAVAAGSGGGGGDAAGGGEEKTAFNVVLKETGGQKIAVIKAVREITGLGLKEAKDVVDNNATVLENAPKDKAEEAVKKLSEAGATAELE
ncbi:50S ribosomal protein L7/L12 [Candidatus Peregrinibacteria bacterium]|jgi:large subunit ribosomal protein L7/L12|nr:50S ribosomal protein L7/L12 [Candidatus Peregrinibacteria bacterium]MBT4631484.1 50S ribosomal protein L7/L12 [Candidatus Peregrinibacteria bacterium]MBT5516590.1 50S ribosomal protein L7/L12 [Candidatus Peregrinibacteria bacterium]MBT5823873.1 50S ribosomal protein L7/L12 [Candidatus Peregrinibacteria bacterium]